MFMSQTLQKGAYVVLIILMFGVTSGGFGVS